jgi:HAD superfamily hydrolase (TIGR01549 family)
VQGGLDRGVLNPAAATTADVGALTLDLDDTLWPIAPVMARCEQVLHDFLAEHAPPVAARFPLPTMRELRDRIAGERPDLAHDYSALRRLSLQQAFHDAGHVDDEVVERAYEIFYATRNEVECYGEVLEVLPGMAARHRIVALTNGTADLARIGLMPHFHAVVLARDVGCAKPDARMFAHACDLLGMAPGRVWHVGDDPDLDVVGAHRAGLKAVWLNREGRDWPYANDPHPDLVVRDLAELDAWLAAQARG